MNIWTHTYIFWNQNPTILHTNPCMQKPHFCFTYRNVKWQMKNPHVKHQLLEYYANLNYIFLRKKLLNNSSHNACLLHCLYLHMNKGSQKFLSRAASVWISKVSPAMSSKDFRWTELPWFWFAMLLLFLKLYFICKFCYNLQEPFLVLTISFLFSNQVLKWNLEPRSLMVWFFSLHHLAIRRSILHCSWRVGVLTFFLIHRYNKSQDPIKIAYIIYLCTFYMLILGWSFS